MFFRVYNLLLSLLVLGVFFVKGLALVGRQAL